MRFKRGVFVFLALILSSTLVSAAYLPPIRQVMSDVVQSFVDIFSPVFNALLGGGTGDTMLFEKILFFVILLCLVYISLGFIPLFEDQKWGRWIIAIIVPLIGVRFLDINWLLAVIMQYKILAIVLTGLLPFIIYFFFLHNVAGDYGVIRKVGWIFFIVVYLALWSTVADDVYGQIYFWTMVISLIFLLADGTIHRFYVNQEMKNAGLTDKWQHIGKLRKEISETIASMNAGHIPPRIGKRIISKKEKQIAWLLKH